MSSGENFDKAVKYAAMAVKIRAAVIEGMTPAIPYLLRFNVSDYTNYIEYMRARCLSDIYASGLYEAYIGSCKELAAYLKNSMPPTADTPPAWKSVTQEQVAQFIVTLENRRFAAGGAEPEPVSDEYLDNPQWYVPWGKTQIDPVGKTLSEMFLAETWERQQTFVYQWLNRPNAGEEAKQLEYGSIDLSEDPSLDEPGDSSASPGAGKKTPYMLSNYYSNVFPIKQHRLAMATDEKGFWAKTRELPILTVNGVPMTGDQALEGALQSMCLNLDAMSEMHKKLKNDAYKPRRIFDEGAFSFPSQAKPGDLKGENLLDALIVVETTAFINKVKTSKEDPETDWDFPLDYGYKFFKNLVPKPMPENIIEVMEQTLGRYFPPLAEKLAMHWRHPERLMYVPVIDNKVTGGGLTVSQSALGKEQLLGNFPWKLTETALNKQTIDEADAEDMVAELAFSRGGTDSNSTGCPVISATVKEKGPKDRYNGGALYHIQQYPTDDHEPNAGRWMLQYFCKVDTDLWERVYSEDHPTHANQSMETPGLRNLLYLFNGRGPNLKGAINPHYWNDAMNAFFNELQQRIDNSNSPLDFTAEDLQKFKNRQGGRYADVRMGLRLCWWQPSGMPMFKEGHAKFPNLDRKTNEEPPQDLYYWWTENEYGNKDLIKAYVEINGSQPHLKRKMRKKFLLDKADAYVALHVQEPQYHETTYNDVAMPPVLLTSFEHTKIIPEYAFCFPVCEVLSDEPVTLDSPLLGTGNWQILEPDLDISDIWNPDTGINKLIKKMGRDEEFKILFDYIFPIGSVIPEIATIYGMEFWKPVADYMKVRKQYFQGARSASDAMMGTLVQQDNYDFDGSEDNEPPVFALGSR